MKKVIIVEDELILRQGIITLIDWAQLGCEICGDCANGVEAVKLLKRVQADLVISDIKMPGMNGLELAEYIATNHPGISVILLTAYSEFEYAHRALKLGVEDYVLKNDFVRSLPKSIHALLEKKKRLEPSSAQKHPALGRLNLNALVLRGLLNGNIREDQEIAFLFNNRNVVLDNFYVVLVEINETGPWESSHKKRGDISPMQNFFSTALKDYPHFFTKLSPSELYIVVNCTGLSEEQGLKYLKETCHCIMEMLAGYTSYEVNIGLSGRHRDVTEVKTAGEEAHAAAGQIWSKPGLAAYTEIPRPTSPGGEASASGSIKEMIWDFQVSMQRETLIKNIDALFQCFQEQGSSVEKIRINVAFLVSLYCEALLENGIESAVCERIRTETTAGILCKHSPAGIKSTLEQMYAETFEQSHPQHSVKINRLVMQVDSFIGENYAYPIKLDDIADFLHVNSSYLSRLYKKETGESLITALNKFRIAKAKELLISGKHLVAEVGGMVGIEDPAYFTKVFTKYAGVSPKQLAKEPCAAAKSSSGT